MAKTSDSFSSLIRGVSEQVPHQRFPGQSWLQDNMISDPVVGVVRRSGSVLGDLQAVPYAITADTIADVGAFREHSMYLGDEEYSFAYRKFPAPAGSNAPGVIVYNKNTRKIVPVVIHPTTEVSLRKGVSAITSAGRYILVANAQEAPTHTVVDNVAGQWKGTGVVRVGNYSRTYTLTIVQFSTGIKYTGTYTTPTSYYQGVLDTSDIPIYDPPGSTTPNPAYGKLVQDRVNAYQTAVNQWIGTSAAAIVPRNILNNLITSIQAAGFTGALAVVLDTLVCADCVSIVLTDGGDGSTVTSTVQEVEAITELTSVHYPGHHVKVTPKTNSAAGSYYVRARAEDGVSTSWTTVIWEEAAGIEVRPGFVAHIGTLQGGTLYLASSPGDLQGMTGLDVPKWEVSSSGDLDSQALPALFGSGLPISHMRMFQDRLMLISGSTVMLSRTGDYFNLFRKSALQIQNDDPIEMYALGSEDDVITDSALLDRDLILFGDVWQYAISGRDAVSPNTALVSIQSEYKDSNRCSPASAGGFIFYAQPRDHKLTVQQMQTGAYAGTVTSFEVTQQLSKYLQGAPLQIVSTTSPSAMFLRTDALTHGVYLYSYLDAPGGSERVFDAWHRWTWSEKMGTTVTIAAKDGAMLLLTYREYNGQAALALDEFSLQSTSVEPCLDSRRPYSNPRELVVGGSQEDDASIVIGSSGGQYSLIGRSLEQVADLVEDFPDNTGDMVLGYNFQAEWVPTNPFVRDSEDRAILNSRLTISRYTVTVINTAALQVYLQDLEEVGQPWEQIENWIARPAGTWVLNTQQVEEEANISVGVYKETRNCKVSFRSRAWLPMGLSSLEWSGQFFDRR